MPSPIARELARNANAGQAYGSHHAQLCAAACRHNARGNGKSHVQGVCLGVVKTMRGGSTRPSRYRLSSRGYPLIKASSRCGTKRSITLSLPMPGVSCAASSLPACVMVTARACHAAAVSTAMARPWHDQHRGATASSRGACHAGPLGRQLYQWGLATSS